MCSSDLLVFHLGLLMCGLARELFTSLKMPSSRGEKTDPDANGRKEHEGRKALDELVASGGYAM